MTDEQAGAEMRSALDEIVAEGARRMLAAALEAEVDAYVSGLVGERGEDGHRLVVRNGHAEQRLRVPNSHPPCIRGRFERVGAEMVFDTGELVAVATRLFLTRLRWVFAADAVENLS